MHPYPAESLSLYENLTKEDEHILYSVFCYLIRNGGRGSKSFPDSAEQTGEFPFVLVIVSSHHYHHHPHHHHSKYSRFKTQKLKNRNNNN